MAERKSLILFTVVLAVVSVFAATHVWADCPNAPYTIEPLDGYPMVDPGNGEVWWAYGLTVESKKGKYKLSKLKDVFITYAANCPDQSAIDILYPSPAVITPPCGNALPNEGNKWPEICDSYTYKVNLEIKSNTYGEFEFKTTPAAKGTVTVGIYKANGNFWVCGVPGPVCSDQNRDVVLNASIQPQICSGAPDVKFCAIKKNPNSKKPEEVWVANAFDGNGDEVPCEDIVGGGTQVFPTPLDKFYIKKGNKKKRARFLGSYKGGGGIESCMKFARPSGNATCIGPFGGEMYCF